MKAFFLPCLLFLSLALRAADLFTPDFAAPSQLSHRQQREQIAIQNRVLLKINGKAITVMDLVRKLDLLFYRQFPEYSDIAAAKYQYYMANWRALLATMIDDELIMADASEKEVEVTDADIREEMEQLFGPDVVLNLDRIGWTYDEAVKILKEEFIVRRMVQMMVRSKANVAVHPREMKKFFQKMSESEPEEPIWNYEMLTVNSSGDEASTKSLQEAFEMLVEKKINLEGAVEALKAKGLEARFSEFSRKASELSDSHKEVLAAIDSRGYSEPRYFPGKKEGTGLFRIFHLQEKKESARLAFQAVEKKIASTLMEEAVSRENSAYLQRLRIHFGITEDYLSKMVPEDFQPFQLR